MNPPLRVLVVGQGYVGLPLSMRAVQVGEDVTAFDVDTRKISLPQRASDGRPRPAPAEIPLLSEVAAEVAIQNGSAEPDELDLIAAHGALPQEVIERDPEVLLTDHDDPDDSRVHQHARSSFNSRGHRRGECAESR